MVKRQNNDVEMMDSTTPVKETDKVNGVTDEPKKDPDLLTLEGSKNHRLLK